MEKQNRAERRRNKFGGGRATEHGGWPTHQPNPVFGADAPDGGTAPPEPDRATTTDAPTEPAAKPSGRRRAEDDEASPNAKG
jgi:hypothetical protein